MMYLRRLIERQRYTVRIQIQMCDGDHENQTQTYSDLGTSTVNRVRLLEQITSRYLICNRNRPYGDRRQTSVDHNFLMIK